MEKKEDKIFKMKAISIILPWGEIILSRGKNVENRKKPFRFRGYIALHVSKKIHLDYFEDCAYYYKLKYDPADLPFGAVIGFAELVDCITKKEVSGKTKKWFNGPFGYVLTNIVKLKNPVPAKGGQTVWHLKGAALKKCLDQLSKKQLRQISIKHK